MEERRRFVRLDTRLPVAYRLLPSAQPEATVTSDIGGGGVCLFLSEPLRPGTRLQVEIKPPDREQPIRFTAEVVWCEEYETISKTRRDRSIEAGVKFIQIEDDDQQAILSHVILSLKPPGPS